MVTSLSAVDGLARADGALLRVVLEVAARSTREDQVPVEELTGGHLREDALPPLLDEVRAEAGELRLALLGDQGAHTAAAWTRSATSRRTAGQSSMPYSRPIRTTTTSVTGST